jgi:hypothetical protein
VSVGISKLNADVTSFDVAFLLKFVAKRFEQARLQVLGEDADTISALLLGARRNRPQGRATRKFDELPPFHPLPPEQPL